MTKMRTPFSAKALWLRALLCFAMAASASAAAETEEPEIQWHTVVGGRVLLHNAIRDRAKVDPVVLREQMRMRDFNAQMVLTLGRVGDPSDIAFIRKLAADEKTAPFNSPNPDFHASIDHVVVWATARLGDPESLAIVAGRLAIPHPNDDVRRWESYAQEMTAAAYIGHPALWPALAESLASEMKRPWFECFIIHAPRYYAKQAIFTMTENLDRREDITDNRPWIQWLRASQGFPPDAPPPDPNAIRRKTK